MKKTATHATATISFGRFDDDPHVISVTTYYGDDDEKGQDSTIHVSDEEWDTAYGDSDAEKIASILDWHHHRKLEYERQNVIVVF